MNGFVDVDMDVDMVVWMGARVTGGRELVSCVVLGPRYQWTTKTTKTCIYPGTAFL